MTHEASIKGIGMSMTQEGMGNPVVLLEVTTEIIPIFVSQHQARSIQQAREDMTVDRPMTHDLFAELLKETGVTLDRVRIDDLEDGTFYAKLDLTQTGEETGKIVQDARPSDGLALAVRLDAPISVATDVIDEAGESPGIFGIEEAGRRETRPGEEQFGERPSVASEESPSIDLDEAVRIEIDDSEEELDEGEDSDT